MVGVVEAGEGEAGVVADHLFAKERQGDGSDEEIFRTLLDSEIGGARQIKFLSERVVLLVVFQRGELVEHGNFLERRARLLKRDVRSGQPFLEGERVHVGWSVEFVVRLRRHLRHLGKHTVEIGS